MDSNAYPALASIHLPAHSRLLRDSCCPDKDIVLVFSHLGGLERISLYHTHNGTKIWETDVGDEAAATSTQVVGISWSPDGRSIALLLNPPRISLLSIQDGHTISTLRINVPEEVERAEQSPLAGISWFRSENRAKKPSTIPDIFRRHNIITGSAESILKNLPLLDPLQEESDKYTATNLFAFQGSQTRSQSKTQLPEAISSWPTLSADPKSPAVDSSIQTKQHSKPEDSLDEVDESNINSVLMVSDVLGNVYSFLDGTFPLGMIKLGRQASFTAVEKSNSGPVFFGHYKFRSGTFESTCIEPTIIDMPLLVNRKMRDFARLSSIARDLTWYIIRVVQEMKSVWYGSGNTTGARDIGPRWVQTLKMKQTEQFGQKGTDPILDLTYLLTTGRASRPLEDFLGGGEQMSERGIQKWESIMSDALIKLRDYSEKRLVPACQRLQLVLEEISAWKLLPLEFGMFDFDTANYEQSIRHTNRGIVLGSLLASVARREFYRFREFIAWLRFEVANTHGPAENNVPRHDILEVNHYLMSGLGSSTIDKWFEGEKLDPTDLEPMPEAHGVELGSLASTLRRAKIAALDAKYQVPPMPTNHLKEVKSLVLISDDIAARCQSSFAQAAAAPSSARNICIRGPPTSSAEANPRLEFQFRERIEQLEASAESTFIH
ncbi:hypothetical protein D9611_006831 [Ephemerocybe angulata]|uniref:Anaphase-promoting complex subunit 4 n=1 Tax=Ephemerocybe angulata TaxID=980116 RepID=A0A8H5AZX1_9AGAR|nr:hypothetical protein D9611_006831 [Tulosesus angulatus]